MLATGALSGCQLVFPLDPGTAEVVFANPTAEDLIDFPVLVSIGAAAIDHAKVEDPEQDLRFVDPDGTPLPFEVEHWDPDDESLVWVRVPQIDRGTEDHMELRYGRGVGAEAANEVWADFELVHHFDRLLTDSALGKHSGTSEGALIVDEGQIGPGRAFPGTGPGFERIELANSGTIFAGWQAYTLEIWFRPDWSSTAQVPDDRVLLDKPNGPVHNVRFFPVSDTAFKMQSDISCVDNGAIVNASVDLGVWTYLTYTYDGAAVRMYFDGEEVGRDACSGGLTGATDALRIGANGTAAPVTFDELRIAETTRSPAWIRAQHLSMTRALATLQ